MGEHPPNRGLAPRPLIFHSQGHITSNGIVICTQDTADASRRRRGWWWARTNCTASALRVRHTRKASPALPTPPRRGRRSPAQQVHYASGTHARAYETALTLLSSPISDMLSPLTYPGRCHTPPRSSASCGSLAPRPLIFLVNAIVRDTLPRMGLLFAHKTQRTHPGGEGDGGGRANSCTASAHTRIRHTNDRTGPDDLSINSRNLSTSDA